MITFACVLTGQGGTYSEEWVQKLKRAVARNCTAPHRFVCLTDRDEIQDVETIKLQHNWPIYWAKLELFKPHQFTGRVIYLDIDILITGDLTPFIKEWDSLMMLSDVFPEIGNSSIMAWDASDTFYHGLYDEMVANSAGIQHHYRDQWPKPNFGDQEFIDHWLAKHGRPHKRWQDELSRDMFVPFSFKSKLNFVIEDRLWPANMRVCYCLGSPKFHQHLEHPLVKEHWV